MGFWNKKKKLTEAPAQDESSEAIFSSARWASHAAGEKSIKVCECMQSAMGMLALTADQKVARAFVEHRQDDGEAYRDKLPADANELAVSHTYKELEPPPDGPVFKAIQMEDKWDIYYLHGAFQFVRSWTGDLVITAEVRIEDKDMHIEKIHTGQTDDPEFALKVVDYLLKSHCLDMIVPHPLPDAVKDLPSDIAKYSFAQHGRRGWMATRDDTLGIYNSNKYGFPAHDTSAQTPGDA